MPLTELQRRSPLPIDLGPILRCIACRAELREQDDGYVCSRCAAGYSTVRGVPRFVEASNYANSFGFQWQQYDRTQLDTEENHVSEIDFLRRTGFTPDEIKGKLILDVGCGMGRFAEVATRYGARVVGVDLSAAVEVAVRNLAQRDFAGLQADVFHLPFAPESFDFIYSIGVLHHTPDCETAVKVLPQYLKPGGTLAVWLYSAYNPWYKFSDIYRKYTSRMSPQTLHRLVRLAVPFFYHLDRGLRKIPLVGKPVAGLIHLMFPVNRNPDPQWRVLDTFDWYSPQYQSKHTYEEVFRWFESCELDKIRVLDVPVAVRGRKPEVSATRRGENSDTANHPLEQER